MRLTQEEYEQYQKQFGKNILKPEDTFSFKCDMCGDCCRKRQEPILLTGVDVFRAARALNVAPGVILREKTKGYIGKDSHVPIIVLKERDDGSCSFLRKGRCMIHENKPIVCAIYPLGRIFDGRYGRYHYFLQPGTCSDPKGAGKEWSLREWLDMFKIEETEAMSAAWSRLLIGIENVTYEMEIKDMPEELIVCVGQVLYANYDISKPYIEQVEQNMAIIKYIFKEKFHKDIVF